MVRHIVLWKLHPQAQGRDKAANAREVKRLLEGLVGVVPEIRSLEVGVNVLDGAGNHDVVLNATFDDLAALDRYQRHPEHCRVAALVGQLRAERSAADYEF